VFALDGRKAAGNVLPAFERTEAEMHERPLGQDFEKSSFTQGCPFSIGGGRLYIRSEDLWYCIGAK
jgi:hypothetical protein